MTVAELRRHRASFLAAEGLPASDIAARLGHADGGALASRVYVHPPEENSDGLLRTWIASSPLGRFKGRGMAEAVPQMHRIGQAAAGYATKRLPSSAEADGNRTRLSRVAAHTGFEDQKH
jgi:hypothetical protein